MTTAQERKKHERRVRRRLIQQAAREIFATRGYAKTSIEQVAQNASLSVGAIYLYFRSKEDLYVSLVEAPLSVMASDLTEACDRVEPGHATPLRRVWNRLIEWAVRDPEGIVALRSLAQPELRSRLSDEVIEAVSSGLRQVNQALQRAVLASVDLGHRPSVDAAAIAEVVWALFLGVVQAADARKTVEPVDPGLERHARLAFDALESGLRAIPARVAEAA